MQDAIHVNRKDIAATVTYDLQSTASTGWATKKNDPICRLHGMHTLPDDLGRWTNGVPVGQFGEFFDYKLIRDDRTI